MELITASKDQWDSFVEKSPQILQTWEWGEIKKSQGWDPIRIAVGENNSISASILLLKRKFPYINKCLFYAPRGPIFDNAGALEYLLQKIKEEAKKHAAIALKIDPEIEDSDSNRIDLFIKKGLKINKKQIQPRSTYFIDLTKDLETLLLSFEEKTRYNIRLSQKKGVIVEELSGQIGVDIFYDLYKETAGRDNFLIHPKSYYQKILSLMGNNNMAKVFIAYLNKEPIAAVINFYFNKRIWYMYGASKSSHRNVMPNHAIHWEIIKRAKGYELYDLWGIPSNPKLGHPLYGVWRFKKGFNGKLVKFVGCMDLVYEPIVYFIFENVFAWFKNIRSLILKGKISDSLEE
ncbi:MAG: hypothetical protein FD145_148 [Candidatus Saganbacteria bacterium]|uniref:Peptidoglycan bridge formation glycyltransferase FemA/FemB family protein n=1 Tax=Candidatus Saganbacteria bacterium TaxID=2575572 RepID=A0A833L2N1_UNCSA|nr:MAG: hypothetical protein FD145_148 [Candidatus Saganbacteria bacterium]